MKRPSNINCGNCVFRHKDRDGRIECWRYPPNVLVQLEDARRWSYPLINDTLFCGEFRPKDNLTAVEWVAWLKGMEKDEVSTK